MPQTKTVHDPGVTVSSSGRRASGAVVPVLAFAGITVAVMQTLLVPVIKDLPVLLHTAPSNATWVMTATLLAGAVATPIMGRLGDLHGKRRMLLASLGVMVIGSLICGFTDNLLIMIVGRALEGFAMGAIPLGIGIMRDELPREKLASAMALMSSSIGVGGGLALPAAALVAQTLDWHALFFAAAGLGVLSMALTLLAVPESRLRAPGSFDKTGAFGLSAGLVALLLPVTKGSDWGWASTNTLGLFGAAVVILLAWAWWELRTPAPLVDLRTSARRVVLLTNLASVMVGVAFYAISLVLPQLLQLPKSTGYGLGQSMVIAGLCVAPLGLTMMLTAPVYARIAARRGPKISLILGMVIIAIGYGGGLGLMNAAWQTIIISVVVGAGIGLAYSSLPALIVSAVDPSETGAANGLNTLMRSIGTSVSSAVIGMVLARTATVTGGVALPTMHGFRVSFVIATVAVIGGIVFASFLPKQRARGAAGGSTAGPDAAAEPVVREQVGGPGVEQAPEQAASAVPGTHAVAEPVAATATAPLAAPTTAPVTELAAAPAGEGPASPGTLMATSGGFHGRVTGADGLPVARATLTLIDRRGMQAGRAVADAEGRYDLVPPASGDFVIAGSAYGHGSQARAAGYAGDGVPVEVDLVLPAAQGAVRESGTA